MLKRALAGGAVILVLLVSLGFVLGLSSHHTPGTGRPVVCAGQCSAPYELDVYFHQGTSAARAHLVVQGCPNPAVISFSVPTRFVAPYTPAVLKTRTFNHSAATRQLISCLTRSPSVENAGFPG